MRAGPLKGGRSRAGSAVDPVAAHAARRGARGAALGAALGVSLLAACTDGRAPTAVSPSMDGSHGLRESYVCTVLLGQPGGADGPSMSCVPARRGAGGVVTRVVRGPGGSVAVADVILGDQGVNIQLNFSNFAFDSTSRVFSLTASVTNLLAQPIGTTDGTTTTFDGVRAFFSSGPSPTGAGSTGVVTVKNPDGVGVFNGLTAPFFRYRPFIPPGGTSAGKVWQFLLGPGVKGFTFQVEVDAAIPAQKSVARWSVLRQGLVPDQLNGIWQNTTSDIWAVGLNNTIVHFNGTQWVHPITGLQFAAYTSVWGSSGTDVWAVGGQGAAVHWNGAKWARTVVSIGGGLAPNLTGVWGSAPNNFYATANGGVAVHFDGVAWSQITLPGLVVGNLHSVWGSDASHVYIVGDNGAIFFFNGTAWTQVASPTTKPLLFVWGSAADNVFAVGGGGTIVHFDGASWSVQASGTVHTLSGVGGTGATDVWAVGATGVTQHFNGTSWSTVPRVVGLLIAAIGSGGPGSLWAVGGGGALLSVANGHFTLSNQSGVPIHGVWASSATDVWASTTGTMLHFDGTNWTSAYVADNDSMYAVWGTGPSNVYTVGVLGAIAHFNGSAWSTAVVKNAPSGPVGYRGVWGSGAADIYAVGSGGLMEHFNGTSWTFQTRAGTADLTGVWGGGSPATFFAVAGDGTGYRHPNGGSWTALSFTPANSSHLAAVFGSAANDAWTTGDGGAVYMTGSGGYVHPLPANATTTNFHGTWLTSAIDVYVVGDGGVIRHFNGSGWATMTTPVTSTLRSAFGTASQNVYVGGDVGVVLLGTGP
jgi:hypothetical protein